MLCELFIDFFSYMEDIYICVCVCALSRVPIYMGKDRKEKRNCVASAGFHRLCAAADILQYHFLSALLLWKIKVYRQFPWLFVSAGERAEKVRRNCKRVDTQSDRRAFVWERKMIYCHWGGSNRVHGELWWRRGGAKLWSCWASIS